MKGKAFALAFAGAALVAVPATTRTAPRRSSPATGGTDALGFLPDGLLEDRHRVGPCGALLAVREIEPHHASKRLQRPGELEHPPVVLVAAGAVRQQENVVRP